MSPLIKQELHQLIDNCHDDVLLEEARSFFQTDPETADWWDELSDEDKNMVMESEASCEKGDFIVHDDLMKQFAAKIYNILIIN